MPGQIWMVHPTGTEPALAHTDAFEAIWGPTGWSEVDIDLDVATAAHGVPITAVDQLDIAYVRKLVAEQRAEPAPKSARKTSIAVPTPAAKTNSEGEH